VTRSVAVVALLLLAPAGAVSAGDGAETFWPQWRGPLFTGVAPKAQPPLEWSETKNVAWKVEIPGKGSATPVVWGDQIFVLTAIPTEVRGAAPKAPEPDPPPATSGRRRRGPRGIPPEFVQQFAILSINRKDGTVAWQRALREERPHEGTHRTGTWASGSAITDGERVYAFFGSRGLYALDMAGELLWEKDLGDMAIKLAFGEGSSPALHDGRLVVNWDHEGDSFVVALDARTGEELWRRSRDEQTSWATPLVVEWDGKAQVVSSATKRVRSYDLATGELLWEASGMTGNVIPTPVHSDGLVYVTSGFRGNALLAVRLAEARGDITGTPAIAWSLDRDTPYVPSPLLYGDQLYLLKSNSGILMAHDAKTGERHYGERLDGVPNVYASPIGAAGRIYVAGREGAVAVVRSGPSFELLAVNELDDGFDASPVAVAGELYLRGKHLYRISED
jgi:outer membrane protein assembly factor BamB